MPKRERWRQDSLISPVELKTRMAAQIVDSAPVQDQRMQGSDCMAEDGVLCEPLSVGYFPANREKYREF
jgi:hypothetical protein